MTAYRQKPLLFNNNDFLFSVSFKCYCSQIGIGLFFQKNCNRRHVQTLSTMLLLMKRCGSLSGRENICLLSLKCCGSLSGRENFGQLKTNKIVKKTRNKYLMGAFHSYPTEKTRVRSPLTSNNFLNKK